jgi:AcrR family transcriptional regulator
MRGTHRIAAISTAAKGNPSQVERVVDSAIDLFYEHGFHRTTMDDVARMAGITKRTLYRYVQNKESLLVLIHGRITQRAEQVAQHDHSDQGIEAQFRFFVSDYIDVVVENQKAVQVFFEDMKYLSGSLRQEVIRERDAFESRIRGILERGIKERVFVDLDITVLSQTIVSGLANTYHWYRKSGQLDPGEIATTVADLFLGGLVSPTVTTVDFRGSPDEHDRLADTPTDSQTPAISHSDVVHRRIVDAAIELFAEKGFGDTSTRELAEAAGLTKSALYYHIESKQSILFHIHHSVASEGLGNLNRCFSQAAGGQELIRALHDVVVFHCRTLSQHRKSVAVFSEEMRFLDGEYRDEVIAQRDAYTELLRKEIVRGNRLGVFDAPMPSIATTTILSVLNAMYRWYRPTGPMSATEIGEIMAHVVLFGLARRVDQQFS